MTFKTLLILLLLYFAYRAIRNLFRAARPQPAGSRIPPRPTYHYHRVPTDTPFDIPYARRKAEDGSEEGGWVTGAAPRGGASPQRPPLVEDAKWRDL